MILALLGGGGGYLYNNQDQIKQQVDEYIEAISARQLEARQRAEEERRQERIKQEQLKKVPRVVIACFEAAIDATHPARGRQA